MGRSPSLGLGGHFLFWRKCAAGTIFWEKSTFLKKLSKKFLTNI
jgi:hypothetical protein